MLRLPVLAPRRVGAADERGSIAVAMTVMLVLTGLSVAVLARTLGALTNVRHHQDYTAALAAADAGLADALFRIDQQGDNTSTIGSTSAPVTGKVGAAGAVSEGSYKYVATRIDKLTFEILSKGTVNGRPHALKATVKRRLKYPHALFARNGISFRGAAESSISAYPGPGDAFVGSNGGIVVASGKTAGTGQIYYTPSGSCSGCANPIPAEGPYLTPDPVVPSNPSPGGCPGALGNIDASAGPVQIPAGTYVCDQDVSFKNGTITVGGPVQIYMTKSGTNIRLKSVKVNDGGNSQNLQIFKIGAGEIIEDATPNEIFFTGIIYAPGTDWKANKGTTTLTGALVLNFLESTSAKKLVIRYDQGLQTMVENDWKLKHYTEVPFASVGF